MLQCATTCGPSLITTLPGSPFCTTASHNKVASDKNLSWSSNAFASSRGDWVKLKRIKVFVIQFKCINKEWAQTSISTTLVTAFGYALGDFMCYHPTLMRITCFCPGNKVRFPLLWKFWSCFRFHQRDQNWNKNWIRFIFGFGDKIWTEFCFFVVCEIQNLIKIFTKEEI